MLETAALPVSESCRGFPEISHSSDIETDVTCYRLTVPCALLGESKTRRNVKVIF